MDDVNIMSREKNGMDVIDHNRSQRLVTIREKIGRKTEAIGYFKEEKSKKYDEKEK